MTRISRLKEKCSKNGYFDKKIKNFHKSKSDFYEKLSTRACRFYDTMHFKQFHFFKRDLQKGPKCYEKMHGLGIIQKVQQYLKLVRIFWRNCLEFFSSQVNGDRS